MNNTKTLNQNSRLTEIDLARALAAIAVVALHALGYSLSRDPSGSLAQQVDQALVVALRFARQVFLFVSGFALAYAYRNRPPGLWNFLSRRTGRIILPYLVWTAIYLRYSVPAGERLFAYPEAVFLGTAFYHLYYIIVSLQWYILFPTVMGVVSQMKQSQTWRATAYVAVGHLALAVWLTAGAPLPSWAEPAGAFLAYRDQLLISYLGYYLLGTLAGVHARSVIGWFRQHLAAFSLMMAGILGFLILDLFRPGSPGFGYVIDIFRPALTIYGALGVAVVLGLSARVAAGGGWLYRGLLALGRDSYAIYLAHPLVLFLVQVKWLLPREGHHPLVSVPLIVLGVLVPFAVARLIHKTPLAPIFFGRGAWWPWRQPAPAAQASTAS